MDRINSDRGAILCRMTEIGNELLEHKTNGISAIDLAEKLGLGRRTMIRYLNAFYGAGWADPTTLDPKPGRKWRPGPVLVAWTEGRAL